MFFRKLYVLHIFNLFSKCYYHVVSLELFSFFNLVYLKYIFKNLNDNTSFNLSILLVLKVHQPSQLSLLIKKLLLTETN